MHPGDDDDEELFRRLQAEYDAEGRSWSTPGRRRPPARSAAPLPRSRRLFSWVFVLAVGLWSFHGSEFGRQVLAPFTDRMQLVDPGPGEHAFLRSGPDGTPVRWSSCRPVRVVINDGLRPVEAWDVVERGLAEVATASGLDIEVVGRTDEAPSDRRPGEQPRYGVGWAPVLVAWTTPEAVPGLAGSTIGLGGASAVTHANGSQQYVTGQITLDAPAFAEMLDGPEGEARARAVVMHEMGHVLGLDHVESPFEVMAAANGPTRFGRGDLAGLKIAGSGPCL